MVMVVPVKNAWWLRRVEKTKMSEEKEKKR